MFPLLQIKNLQIDFVTEIGTLTAVKDLSLEISRGEIVGIVGESGSGKSVTALSILQLLSAATARFVKGQILFSADGISQTELIGLERKALQSIRGKEISMIFQEPMTSLNPVFTCGYQVMEAIRLHEQVPEDMARKKAIDLFEKVRLPDPAAIFHRYPHQLSGGQKQRAMIAMAVSCNPALLICDEPTTALDVTVQKTVLELIREIQVTTGMGVIFITHDLGVIAEIAQRAIVMYKGAIVEQATVENIFSAPRHPYTKALLACRPALHPKGERLPVVSDFMHNESFPEIKKDQRTAMNPLPATAVKNNKAGSYGDPGQRGNIPLLSVKNLQVWFPAKKEILRKTGKVIKALDGVSFEVAAGETLGLVGESGCGKTTVGRSLLRLIRPTGGEITYRGVNLASLGNKEMKQFRKHMQIIFQDPYSSLNPSLTIGSAIEEPLKVHGLEPNAKRRKEKVIELLEKVNLRPDQYYRYPHEFSGGQRQRIVIARALALEPELIICDESVAALDVSIQAQMLNLLNDLKKEFGFTSIFISHDLSVVRYISDRIMVMSQGKIVETGDAEQVFRSPQSPYTRKLLDAIPRPAVKK